MTCCARRGLALIPAGKSSLSVMRLFFFNSHRGYSYRAKWGCADENFLIKRKILILEAGFCFVLAVYHVSKCYSRTNI
ncbi:MAG: hypothetical protein Ct9H90mP27_7400 [Gammaproteobacteria bacterium]|nr:MAG: hypothetical protein Ct9H90mP27_7400 [Gammaproteobacteria bacterium]